MKIQPNDATALSGLANVLWQANKKGEAVLIAERAHAADPTHSQVRFVYGMIMLKSGKNIGTALEGWKALQAEDPEYAKQTGVTAMLERIGKFSKPTQ